MQRVRIDLETSGSDFFKDERARRDAIASKRVECQPLHEPGQAGAFRYAVRRRVLNQYLVPHGVREVIYCLHPIYPPDEHVLL